jgi:molecular chaperone GrpE
MWSFRELEFVIDEKPVPIAEGTMESAEQDGFDDLVDQVGALLAENGRLAASVKTLERTQSGSGELDQLMRRLLAVLDGFERILEVGRDFPDDHAITNWLRSVESLYFRLKNLLEKFGLFGIEAVGQPVNLDIHEVVEYRPSPDHEPDTVIAVRKRGYVLRGRLLREAKVVVAANERS